ncbi:hypothetical protein F4780DRAFT_759337 [Xylariomycetidae sp. FL0641]|nr:hypothetical protein F4780DRAFT_759337 [Xylariomycetidae sp. FL0641]
MASVTSKIQDAAPRNKELLNILSETDHAIPALQQQNIFINDLDRQLSDVENRIAALEKERAKELKDHEKYRDSVMKRFAYRVSGKTDKFAAKAEKEEREYFDVLQKSHKAQSEKENLQGMRADAQSTRSDLEAQVARHNQAQQDLDSLYNSIFQGPTPEFPEEDASERNSESALHAYHDSRVRMEAELQAVQSLDEARKQLNNALASIEDALDHSRMDMFGGGTVSDMMERDALFQAERAVGRMYALVAQAQRMSPHVQSLPPAHIAEGNLTSDVFFDNIFSDMAFHDKIKDSRDELRRAGDALIVQLANAQSRHQACQQEMARNAGALNTARLNLQRARQRIFERASNDAADAADDAPPSY